MKYLFVLIALFAMALVGVFLAGEEETPTENLDNVKNKMEHLKLT